VGKRIFRKSYRYRDWVVSAFNRDLPYDQFVREQIAGDLLQPKDPEQIDTNGIIATGMYAIGNWGNGDADKEKILTDIADDQVDVTGRAFLGLTLACARCHDHKFDPIPTADYYSAGRDFLQQPYPAKADAERSGREFAVYSARIQTRKLDRRQKREGAHGGTGPRKFAAITDEQLALVAKKTLSQSADYLTAVAAYQNRTADKSKFERGTIRGDLCWRI